MKMNSKNKVMLPLMMMVALLAVSGMESKAQDWPQWRGPDREGVVKATGLNLNWSEKAPALSWTFREAGAGYSAPTIVGTTLYCQGAAEGNDFAFALDTETGNLKWKQNLGKQHEAIQNRGNGPRGSVTVDGDKLYLIRGAGQIHCLAAADGEMIWQKDLVNDFAGKMMSGWGYSESPLVDGDLVVCTPGGSAGTMLALDKNTGDPVWRSKEWTDEAAYSSPIIAEVDGIRQYVQQSGKGFAGVAAKDGELLWRIEVPAYRTAIIPTPLFYDDRVYITAGYNAGCQLVKLTRAGDKINTETVYANNNIVNQHGGVVLMNGYVYGYSEDRAWVCQDVQTGETVWREKNNEVGKGAVLGVNDRLLLLDMQTGLLAVVAASPEGWKEFGRLPIPERTEIITTDNHVWTHPVVANGKLYVRDHDLLFCFDLKN